jgi:rhodanese-related sulfurtransferase
LFQPTHKKEEKMKKIVVKLSVVMVVLLAFCLPAHAEDWMAKGDEAFNKGDFKVAVEAYQNAIKAEPDNRKAWRSYEDSVVCQKADALLTMSDTLPIWIFKAEPDLVQEIREKKEVFLIDVRRPKELEDFRLAGTHNIDLKDLAKSLDKLPKNKATYIVTICRTGARATLAASMLRMMGYTNVWAMIDAKMPPAGGIPSLTLILGNEAKK